MKDQFVPYEIAKMLRELGFDEQCVTSFNQNGRLRSLFLSPAKNSHYKPNTIIAAPLWQQVKQWLWEKHKIHIETNEDFYNATRFETFIRDKGFKQVGYFDSPITAEIEGIKKAVEYLHSKLK